MVEHWGCWRWEALRPNILNDALGVAFVVAVPEEENRIEIMGVLSDVFIASPDQLTVEILEHGPIGRLPSVEGKRLFPDDILKL